MGHDATALCGRCAALRFCRHWKTAMSVDGVSRGLLSSLRSTDFHVYGSGPVTLHENLWLPVTNTLLEAVAHSIRPVVRRHRAIISSPPGSLANKLFLSSVLLEIANGQRTFRGADLCCARRFRYLMPYHSRQRLRTRERAIKCELCSRQVQSRDSMRRVAGCGDHATSAATVTNVSSSRIVSVPSRRQVRRSRRAWVATQQQHRAWNLQTR